MTGQDERDYTCPGRQMPQPPGAPYVGYVACYRAGHTCTTATTTTRDATHTVSTTRCTCCGEYYGTLALLNEWLDGGAGAP